MAGRKRIELQQQRKAERTKTEAIASTCRTSFNTTSSSNSTSSPMSRDRYAKKLQYARAKGFAATRAGKRYSDKNFAAQSVNAIQRSSGLTAETDTDDPIVMLRREIREWRTYETLTNTVRDKLTKIESSGAPTESAMYKSQTPRTGNSQESHERDYRRNA